MKCIVLAVTLFTNIKAGSLHCGATVASEGETGMAEVGPTELRSEEICQAKELEVALCRSYMGVQPRATGVLE